VEKRRIADSLENAAADAERAKKHTRKKAVSKRKSK